MRYEGVKFFRRLESPAFGFEWRPHKDAKQSSIEFVGARHLLNPELAFGFMSRSDLRARPFLLDQVPRRDEQDLFGWSVRDEAGRYQHQIGGRRLASSKV